jgi:hypothetical protein
MNWLTILVGVLIGWLAEWLIDLFYWRRRGQAQTTGTDAGGGPQDSQGQRDAEILFQDCWRTLSERTAEIERLKAQLAALQGERRSPPAVER